MLHLKTPEEQECANVRRRVLACMETGNHSEARTILTELKALHPQFAEVLRVDLVASYGTLL